MNSRSGANQKGKSRPAASNNSRSRTPASVQMAPKGKKKKKPKNCPKKAINDAKVVQYIKQALAYYNVKGLNMSPGQKVDAAWSTLKNKRDNKAYHCDWDLAAAEHYMLTRSFSSHGNWVLWFLGSPKTPPGGVLAMVAVYNMIKGSVGMFKQGTGPHSPVTAKAIAWAQQGTIDGTYFPFKYLGKACQVYYFRGKIGKKKFKKSDNVLVIEQKKLNAPSNASVNMGVPRIKIQPVTHSGYRAFGRFPVRWVKVSDLTCYH